MRGGERGERLKAIHTLQEQRWWDAACPPPSAAYRPSIAHASPRLTMSSPSLASGTLCVAEVDEDVGLQGKLSAVGG